MRLPDMLQRASGKTYLTLALVAHGVAPLPSSIASLGRWRRPLDLSSNRILDELVAAISPRRMTGETLWNVRGGITTTVTASHP